MIPYSRRHQTPLVYFHERSVLFLRKKNARRIHDTDGILVREQGYFGYTIIVFLRLWLFILCILLRTIYVRTLPTHPPTHSLDECFAGLRASFDFPRTPGHTQQQQAGSGDDRRLSLPGRPSSGSTIPRSHGSIAASSQRQGSAPLSGQMSPPLQPMMRQHREQQVYGSRRSSSPGGDPSRSRGGDPADATYSSGGSPLPVGLPSSSMRSPPSTLPQGQGHNAAFSSAGGSGGGGGGAPSSMANNHDDASSMFGSNLSGHSNYSGFSAISSMHAFGGGSEFSSVGGGGSTASGLATHGPSLLSSSSSWRATPLAGQKGDHHSAALDGGENPPAHGSTGGALGWGSIMGSGGAAGSTAGGGGAGDGPG